MSAYFFDSSAIVKRYIDEPGTAWVTSVIDPEAGHDIYICRIAGAEVISAIARRGHRGDLTANNSTKSIRQFRQEFTRVYRIVEITPALILRSMELAEAHALRGYDSVQLAAALEVNVLRLTLGMSALTLVSADSELNAAATAEGLIVDDPNSHS